MATLRVQAYLLPFAGAPDCATYRPTGALADEKTLHGRESGRASRAASILTSTFHSTMMSLRETHGLHSSVESFNSGNAALRWQTDRAPAPPAAFATSPPTHAHPKQRLHLNRRKNCAPGTLLIKQENYTSPTLARGKLPLHQYHPKSQNRNPGSSKDPVFADPQPTQARHQQSRLVLLRSVAE